MKVKFIIDVNDEEIQPICIWDDLPIIPQQDIYILMFDLLSDEQYQTVWINAKDWSSEYGLIYKVVLRKDDDYEDEDEERGWMYEIYIKCED